MRWQDDTRRHPSLGNVTPLHPTRRPRHGWRLAAACAYGIALGALLPNQFVVLFLGVATVLTVVSCGWFEEKR